jgi:hypothetical protein
VLERAMTRWLALCLTLIAAALTSDSFHSSSLSKRIDTAEMGFEEFAGNVSLSQLAVSFTHR